MLSGHVRLLREEGRAILFGALCLFMASPGQTYVFAVFVGSLGLAAGLSPAELGTLYLIGTLGSAALLPLAGHWIDRVDLKRYVALSFACLAAACFLGSIVNGPITLLIAFVALRLSGQGLMTHISVTSTARYFGARRGLALSMTSLGIALSAAVTPIISVVAIGVIGWRLTYVAFGVFSLCIALPLLLMLIVRRPTFTRPPPRSDGAREPRARDGMMILVRSRYFWFACAAMIFHPFTSTALIFHIESIGTSKGWSLDLVATSFVAFAVGQVVSLLLAGAIIDRLGARTVLVLMNVPLMVGLVVFALSDHPTALFICLGLAGVTSGLFQTAVGAVWAEVYGTASLGTIRSAAHMLLVASTACGPAAIGLGLELGFSVEANLWVLLGIGIVATMIAWRGIHPGPYRWKIGTQGNVG
jgi:MFS family permease